MRQFNPLHPRRRDVLRTLAAAGAGAALTGSAMADQNDSLWDTLARNRVLRNTDREGNTTQALDAIDTAEPILSYDTSYNLDLATRQYEQIVADGGWEQMPREVFGLIVGNNRPSVSRLKKRLVVSGDLSPNARMNDLFDADLDMAVRRFQARHGLYVTGKVAEDTYYALNVTADYRLQQLRLNTQRVATMASSLPEQYVVVNIPAAAIEAIEGGTVVQRHTAIVGRIDRQTPILKSKIFQINFHPYWHVPKSIIQRDIIKVMKEDPGYLARYKIRIFDNAGNEIDPATIDWNTDEAVQYAFTQDPGAENAMGNVKIMFYNPYDVYMHDTPEKSLFGENQRFHSSGCVRVDQVDTLVAWLLKDTDGWDLPAVESEFASGTRLDVNIKNPVPILTTYITAWANRQGTVSFRDDVYNFDGEGKIALL
ncbi:MAG TPA: L,D-transpeptidase family protein [Devosiaceae bacterium]